ncbi:MAG: AEC family transporter [bacterium]
MIHPIQGIIPIFISFFVGILIRNRKILNKEDGKKILKLVFYFTLPASIFLSASHVTISIDYLFLPVIAMITFLTLTVVSFFLFHPYKESPEKFGVIIIASIIMNTAFVYPFISAGYGTSGFTKAVLFDLGNGVLTLSVAYWIACKYGSNKTRNLYILKKVLQSPPLWALGLGLLVNVFNINYAHFIELSLQFLGRVTFPLIMISLGIIFSLKFTSLKLLISVLGLRFLGGFMIGYLAVTLLGVTGEARTIALICCCAPIGMNTLIFSNLTNLDTELAANLVSFGIGLGLIITSFMILFSG